MYSPSDLISDISSPSASSTRPANKTQRTTADYSLSCAECRRLKLKCSRQQWPCDTCIKRGIPHLCPDGIQKKDKNKVSLSSSISAKETFALPSHRVNNSSDAGRTTDQALYFRLDSLEKKLDRLIEASSSSTATRRTEIPFNGSLHDLASIATDHYTLGSGQSGSSSQNGDDTTRQQHGTLTLHADGRAHYMGSNAHSMYLAQEKPDGRRVSFREELISRPGSPTPIDLEAASHPPSSSIMTARKKADTGSGASPEGDTPSTIESQPAQLVWATPGFRSPHSSTAIWNFVKQVLPTPELALRMVDVYYATVTFMFHPITRSDFDATVWSVFYSRPNISSYTPPANFHPHKLALLYSMLSVGVLLDVKRPQRDPVGMSLYSCAWNALCLSNFTESTSLEAILALMHINMYLTWRRGGKYAESAYPLLGTMMRMAISTGLHRDPAQFNLQEQEREKRRRVFWDIQCSEVFRAFAFCRPPALCDRHVDTRLPLEWQPPEQVGSGSTMPTSASKREGEFHAIKCRQIQVINRMLDECLCQTSTYQRTIQFDKNLRQLYNDMPNWMLPDLVELGTDQSTTVGQDLERSYNDVSFREEMILEMQRHTTLLNHHQALLLLHRGWFSQALQLEAGSPGAPQLSAPKGASAKEARLTTSIDAVNESASQMIAITVSAWSKYPALIIRWAFFWNCIFSAAVCRGLYILKYPQDLSEAETAWLDLKRSIELFSRAVVGWAPLESPLSILKRLYKRAEVVMNGQAQLEMSRGGTSAESEGEDLELIGNERKRSMKRKPIDGDLTPRKQRNSKKIAIAKSEAEEEQMSEGYNVMMPSTSANSTLVDNSSIAFDLSQIQSSTFDGLEPPLFHSSQLPTSIFANTINNTDEPSASQLIQMLSSGLSWDDVSSWNDLIVDL